MLFSVAIEYRLYKSTFTRRAIYIYISLSLLSVTTVYVFPSAALGLAGKYSPSTDAVVSHMLVKICQDTLDVTVTFCLVMMFYQDMKQISNNM